MAGAVQEYTHYYIPALFGPVFPTRLVHARYYIYSGASQEEPQSKRQRASDEPAQGAAEVPIDGADLLSTQVCGEEF